MTFQYPNLLWLWLLVIPGLGAFFWWSWRERQGGYGERIATGLALNDHATLIAGALPAAVLALLTQGVFELVERRLRRHRSAPAA